MAERTRRTAGIGWGKVVLVGMALATVAAHAQALDALPGYGPFLKALTKSAEGGNPEAEYALGMMHEDAVGFPKDYHQAFIWLEKAADHGHAEAQNELAALYRNGHGIQPDNKASVKYLRLAAAQGHVVAERHLGLALLRGAGASYDPVEGRAWISKAAEGGDAEAQDALANMALQGYGGPKDYILADKWCRAAALQGFGPSMYRLGSWYESGKPMDVNLVEAVRWYREAAKVHNGPSLLRLANMADQGVGMAKDPIQGALWRKEAQLQGSLPGGGVVGGRINMVNVDFSKVKATLNPPTPPYPSVAREAHVEGVVRVELLIDPSGKPTRASAVVGPLELRLAAEEQAMGWRFEPIQVDGVAKWAKFTMDFAFKLDQ